jgi:hypothetical protein
MAILGSVVALLGRFAGRLLNAALGWATLLLFGKVEGRKQTVLLLIALGSLVWILVVIGVAWPDLGTFMLAFVPVPDFVDEGVVRLVMLGLAALIPLGIGAAAVYVTEASARPRAAGLIRGVLRGYPFTVVLALTIVFLAVVSVVRKIRSLWKRWEDAHVPIVVKPGGYERLIRDLEEVLDAAGLDASRKAAPRILSLPPRILDAVAGKAFGNLVPDRLLLLVGGELEILVYPSDIAIAGTKRATARARAAIAARLTRSPAFLTTSAESQRIEEEIEAIATRPLRSAADVDQGRRRLADLDERIATLTVSFDEWETVYRERLQVERDLLASQRIPGPSAPPRKPSPSLADRLVGVVGLTLVLVDVVLVVLDRRGTSSPRR